MKTTVEISDALLDQARRQAAREGSSVRALIEEGLRKVLDERILNAGQFQLRKVTFGGAGLQAALADAPWDTVRDMIYDGNSI